MSDKAAQPGRDTTVTEQAADGTWAGLRQQKKVLGLSWHWWIWITVIYLNVMDGATSEMWKIAAPLLRTDMGWTNVAVTGVRSFGGYWNIAWYPLVGWLYERYFRAHPKGLMWMFLIQVVGEIGWGVFALFLAPARFWAYWAMEIIYRTGVIFGGMAQYMVIVNWFETRRGLALGMTGTSGEGGTPLLWGVLGARFITWFGYKKAWFYASLFLLPIIPLMLIFMRNWPSDVGVLPWGADPKRAHEYISTVKTDRAMSKAERKLAGIPPAQRWGFTLLESFKVPGTWLLMLTSFLSPLFYAFQSQGIGLHGKAIGMTTDQVGLAVSVFGIFYVVQGAVLGQVFDWRGWDYKYACSWGPFGGIFIASTILAYSRNFAGFVIGYGAVAMGTAAWAPMWTAKIADTYGPMAMGTVWSIVYRFTTGAGSPIAVYFIGWIMDRYGNLYGAFQMNIWTGLACCVIFYLAMKPSLKAYRNLKSPPPWAFAKNADAVRKQPRRVIPIYD